MPAFPTSLILIFYGLFILSRFPCRPWQLLWFTFRLWSSEQYIVLPHFDKKCLKLRLGSTELSALNSNPTSSLHLVIELSMNRDVRQPFLIIAF